VLVAVLVLAGLDSAPLAASTGESRQASPRPRFFLSGDGLLAVKNAHSGEARRVRFRDRSGSYSASALSELASLFRSRGDDRTAPLSLRLVELLDYLEDRVKPSELLLMSGFRSSEYNAEIRDRGGQAAKSSLHTEGLAADVRFVGVEQRGLWNKVRALDCCGAGYYATGHFLHLDIGRPRFWEETTSRVGENLSAGNARVFARTDFDRYATLEAAVVSLHAVTLHPLRIRRRAELLPEPLAEERGERGLSLVLAARSGRTLEVLDDCFVLRAPPAEPPERFVLTGEGAESPGPKAGEHGRGGAGRLKGRIVLETCKPRLEATPERIETNPIEIGG
jgi:uncharacterized protein YcbK (DUF882 family)